MFRCFLAPLFAYLTISVSVACSQDAPQRMVPDDEAQSWFGIAKLNVAGNRWCNAVLVSEVEVLTAAHCLFHPLTQRFSEAENIKIIFGQRRDEYVALRGVTDRVVLPEFSPTIGDRADIDQITHDLALLRLDAPISTHEIWPFEIKDWQPNQRVVVTGYGRDRPYLPSLRENCFLTPLTTSIAKLDCAIVPGLSGAAVTAKTSANELPALLGIVSANLHDPTGMKIGEGLVVRIKPTLEKLRALLP